MRTKLCRLSSNVKWYLGKKISFVSAPGATVATVLCPSLPEHIRTDLDTLPCAMKGP